MSEPTATLEQALASIKPESDKSPAGAIIGVPEILAYVPSPDEYRLGDGFLGRGSINAMCGPPNVGKTRLAIHLAVTHLAGRPWLGLPTRGHKAKWLFIGSENSRARLKCDMVNLIAPLTAAEREAVNAGLRFFLEPAFLDEEAGVAYLGAVINEEKPDIIVLDTLMSSCCGYDLNKDADMRAAVQQVEILFRVAAPGASALIIHHARHGSENMKQAMDAYGAGAYSRNSKVLVGLCRGVLNLMPGDREDCTRLVLTAGKVNDGRPFDPIGIRWQDSLGYEIDPDFDYENYRNDLDGKRSGASVAIMDILNLVEAGKHKRSDIVATLKESTGASQPTIDRRLKDAAKQGYLESTTPRGSYILTVKGLARLAKP